MELPDTTLVDLAVPVGFHQIHRDQSINFQLNRVLHYLGSEALEEIRAAAQRIGTYEDWAREFLALAAAARAGRDRLRAAYYDRAAAFFMTARDPRRPRARARFLDDIRTAYAVTPEAVPYRDATLPAYDLRPDDVPLGTVVVCGGFDEYIEENLGIAVTWVRRGYRVVLFDGPGQGGALEEGDLAMTPAWEEPVAVILDHFDLDDVTLLGISLGGGLAIRAAAGEPRVRRVVACDVLDDFLECLGRAAAYDISGLLRLGLRLRARPLVNLAAGAVARRSPLAAWGLEQGRYVTGTRDAYGFFRAAEALNTKGVSGKVTADVLLLAGAEDHYVPRHQLDRQAAALVNARSITTRVFTGKDGAGQHCQIGNIGAALAVMESWLASLAPLERT